MQKNYICMILFIKYYQLGLNLSANNKENQIKSLIFAEKLL